MYHHNRRACVLWIDKKADICYLNSLIAHLVVIVLGMMCKRYLDEFICGVFNVLGCDCTS